MPYREIVVAAPFLCAADPAAARFSSWICCCIEQHAIDALVAEVSALHVDITCKGETAICTFRSTSATAGARPGHPLCFRRIAREIQLAPSATSPFSSFSQKKQKKEQQRGTLKSRNARFPRFSLLDFCFFPGERKVICESSKPHAKRKKCRGLKKFLFRNAQRRNRF